MRPAHAEDPVMSTFHERLTVVVWVTLAGCLAVTGGAAAAAARLLGA